LAVDGERRREGRVARRAATQDAAPAPAALGHLLLELEEPPPRGPAVEAEGGPVAEHIPALLAKPVGCLAHARTVSDRPRRHLRCPLVKTAFHGLEHASMASASRTAHSQSLERGLAILSSFRSDRPLLGVSELSREVGLSRSTTHRYIATLAGLGYLEQDSASRKYRLGPRVLDLGFSAINSMDLREVAAPHLQALSDETGHTVNMAVLDGADIVYIERCRTARQGQREIDLNLHVGSRLPAYCTSLGKVLLANLPPDQLQETLQRVELTQRGPNTLTASDALLRELERVRRDDLATNNEELAYGLRSIAAPIRSQMGDVVAAINLAAHRSMVSFDALVARLGPPLRRTAAEISGRIGWAHAR